MKIIWRENDFEMGYTTRGEIEVLGFESIGKMYHMREVYKREGERIYFDARDCWFSRTKPESQTLKSRHTMKNRGDESDSTSEAYSGRN